MKKSAKELLKKSKVYENLPKGDVNIVVMKNGMEKTNYSLKFIDEKNKIPTKTEIGSLTKGKLTSGLERLGLKNDGKVPDLKARLREYYYGDSSMLSLYPHD